MAFWEDLSCCCCTAIVGTFSLIPALPSAAVEVLIPTLSTSHSSPLQSHVSTVGNFCLPSSHPPAPCLKLPGAGGSPTEPEV